MKIRSITSSATGALNNFESFFKILFLDEERITFLD